MTNRIKNLTTVDLKKDQVELLNRGLNMVITNERSVRNEVITEAVKTAQFLTDKDRVKFELDIASMVLQYGEDKVKPNYEIKRHRKDFFPMPRFAYAGSSFARTVSQRSD